MLPNLMTASSLPTRGLIICHIGPVSALGIRVLGQSLLLQYGTRNLSLTLQRSNARNTTLSCHFSHPYNCPFCHVSMRLYHAWQIPFVILTQIAFSKPSSSYCMQRACPPMKARRFNCTISTSNTPEETAKTPCCPYF